MNKLFGFSFILTVTIVTSLQVSVSSCKKEVVKYDTVIVTDTLLVEKTDTLLVESVDTVFAMDVNAWDAYSYLTDTIVAPGPTTYTNSPEGIKLLAQAVRYGIRLQTKKEIGIKDKTIYLKWKANGAGDFAHYVIQLKWDPTVTDGLPPNQNLDFPDFSTKSTVGNSTLINSDTWYYTRIHAIPGTDNYQFITATGNYDNIGGTEIVNKDVPVYTKHGYLGFRLGDLFNINATLVIAEVRIASN